MWKSYVATAAKSTAVNHAISGTFTRACDRDLVLAKNNRLEIHTVHDDGLKLVLDAEIYGSIAALNFMTLPEYTRSHLVAVTAKNDFFVMSYDAEAGELVTHSHGKVDDKIGRPAECGVMVTVDPFSRCIVMHIVDGMVKVIPTNSDGSMSDAFNVKVDELNILDMSLMMHSECPLLGVLYADSSDNKHFRSYEINIPGRTIQDGPLAVQNLDHGAHRLIAPADGGVIVVGTSIMAHLSVNRCCSIPHRGARIVSHSVVDQDGSRFLLADEYGHILLLIRRNDDFYIQDLGESTVASCICYLDAGLAFLGSASSDSLLIHIRDTEDEFGRLFSHITAFPNIGPITGLSLMDEEWQGQANMVTCSGVGTGGSLRMLRNGVGIDAKAETHLENIRSVFSFEHNSNLEKHTFLLLSFSDETRVFAFIEQELIEVERDNVLWHNPAFDFDSSTIFAGASNGRIFQATSEELLVLDGDNLQLTAKWSPQAGVELGAVAINGDFVLAAIADELYLFDDKLNIINKCTMNSDVSCVDFTSIYRGEGEMEDEIQVACVGLWDDMSVNILEIPSLKCVSSIIPDEGVVPRSAKFCLIEESSESAIQNVTKQYLFVGMGDGQLVMYEIKDDISLDNLFEHEKRLCVGTQHISLAQFKNDGKLCVFACCDRPLIVYCANGKLRFSNVSLRDAKAMAAFDAQGLPNCLAIATSTSLVVGNIDAIQMLHIRSASQGEQTRRVVHMPGSSSLAVAVEHSGSNRTSDKVGLNSLQIVDKETLKPTDFFNLDPCEYILSLLPIQEPKSKKWLLCAGTGYCFPDEFEPRKGRLLVFDVSVDGKKVLLAEQPTAGGIFAMDKFREDCVVFGVNAKVHVFRLQLTDAHRLGWEFAPLCQHHVSVMALFIRACGDFIAVGDMIKSVTMLKYEELSQSLEVSAVDFNSNWMRSLAVYDDCNIIGADSSGNLFWLQRQADAVEDDIRKELRTAGCFHLGDFVNCIHHGSLVHQNNDISLTVKPELIMGTVSGAIIAVIRISDEIYEFLRGLEHAMEKVVHGVGGLSHARYRQFKNETQIKDSVGFIDGDLIESMLDMAPDAQDRILQLFNESCRDSSEQLSMKQCLARVEEMSRTH